jgi:hypothetical protein
MTTVDRSDPLLDALAGLSTHTPRPARDARTLARCYAAMKPASAAAPRPSARTSSRMLDRLLPAALLLYAIVTVAEAIRIGWLKAS